MFYFFQVVRLLTNISILIVIAKEKSNFLLFLCKNIDNQRRNTI